MMWEDAPDYYRTPSLTYTPDIPYALVYPNGPQAVREDGSVGFQHRMSVAQHFKLVNHQLAQIRDAFALAQALGRVLILPRIICGLDRYWAPHRGIIPGSATSLPLLDCPADHVIDLERMQPEKLLREHTLLCNPRVPPEVLTSSRQVELVRTPQSTPFKSSQVRSSELTSAEPSQPPQTNSTLIDVEALRRAHADVTVLVIKGPLPRYTRILTGRRRKDFKHQVRNYASLWCCNHPPGGRGAGHIWYDWLWDVVPHTDRHNRKWTTPWTPKMGP